MTFVNFTLANGHPCAIPNDAPALLVEASPSPTGSPRTCLYLRNMIAFSNGGVSAIVEGFIGDVALALDPSFGAPSSPWAIVPTDDGGAVGLLKTLGRCVEATGPTSSLVWIAAVQPVSTFRMLRVPLPLADVLDLLSVLSLSLAARSGEPAAPPTWPARRDAAPPEASPLGRIAVAAPPPPAVLPAPVPLAGPHITSIGVASTGPALLPLDAPRIAVPAPAPMPAPPTVAAPAVGVPRAFPAPSLIAGVGTRVEASTSPPAVFGPNGLALPDPVADLREAPVAASSSSSTKSGAKTRNR